MQAKRGISPTESDPRVISVPTSRAIRERTNCIPAIGRNAAISGARRRPLRGQQQMVHLSSEIARKGCSERENGPRPHCCETVALLYRLDVGHHVSHLQERHSAARELNDGPDATLRQRLRRSCRAVSLPSSAQGPHRRKRSYRCSSYADVQGSARRYRPLINSTLRNCE